MLHVILTILKIIGILLLVLIALVLFLVLAVLFVPVRYQAFLAFTKERREGEIHLSWFLHLICVRLAYEPSGNENGVRIRILGIDPKRVSAFFKKRKKKNPAGSPRPENREGSFAAKGQEDSPPGKDSKEQDAKTSEPLKEKTQTDHSEQKKAETEKKDTETPKKSKDKKRRRRKKDESWYDRMVKFFKKQVYKLQGICDRIEKISDSRGVLKEARHKAERLLHHYRVRAGSGYLRFGTGDPAATAELTGFLYILLPASCGDIEIDPQFTDAALQTELSIRGHIRLIHLLRTVLWGVFNQDLRQLIRELGGS